MQMSLNCLNISLKGIGGGAGLLTHRLLVLRAKPEEF